jgi:hypothetical protein
MVPCAYQTITDSGKQMRRVWLLFPAALVLLVCLSVSCATLVCPPSDFLRATDNSTDRWLSTVVDVDIAEVRIIHLPLTDAFAGMKLAIARADASVESLRVALHARQVTRRQALWLLAEKYGLSVSVQRVRGQPPYIGISRQ